MQKKKTSNNKLWLRAESIVEITEPLNSQDPKHTWSIFLAIMV